MKKQPDNYYEATRGTWSFINTENLNKFGHALGCECSNCRTLPKIKKENKPRTNGLVMMSDE